MLLYILFSYIAVTAYVLNNVSPDGTIRQDIERYGLIFVLAPISLPVILGRAL